MPDTQPEDPFSNALTEIERLLGVWDDLTTAGVADSSFAPLLHKSVAHLSSPRIHADAIISLQGFSRLFDIHNSLESRGIVQSSLNKLIAEKFIRKMNAHSASRLEERQMSALQRLEDLENCVTLKTMARNKFPNPTIETWVTNIISLDVVALPVQSNVSTDSLRIIEVGAKLLKALPHHHHAKICHVIDSQVKALTASCAYTPGLGYDNKSASHSTLEGPNDSRKDLKMQTAKELTATKTDHVSVTADLKAQVHHLQEPILQLQGVNRKMQQVNNGLAEEKITLEGRGSHLTGSSDTEMSGLQSTINDLQLENAGLTKKLVNSKSRYQGTIHKLEDEIADLQQALSDTDDNVCMLAEELAETEEDKAALARDNDRLAVEKASAEESLAESEDSKIAMSNEIYELSAKNDRLEQALKDANDSLKEAEDDRRVTLSRNVEKLESDKAGLEKELAGAQGILHQISSFSSKQRPTATDSASQKTNANANFGTDTATHSTGVLTPPSSTQTTPR